MAKKTEKQQKAWWKMLDFMNDNPEWTENKTQVRIVQGYCREAGNKIGDGMDKDERMERDNKILKMLSEGKTYREVSKEFDIKLSLLYGVVQRSKKRGDFALC